MKYASSLIFTPFVSTHKPNVHKLSVPKFSPEILLSQHAGDTRKAERTFLPKTEPKTKHTVLIGLGSGRCGTLAFSKFLSAQPKTKIFHEYNSCANFDWAQSKNISDAKNRAEIRYHWYKTRLGRGKRGLELVGDVALWNLPYAEHFLQYEDVKIVVLKRNREDTIRSFVKWFGKFKHFPWVTRNVRQSWKTEVTDQRPPFENLPDFDRCYPVFGLNDFKMELNQTFPTIEQGATVYYDYYYREVDELLNKYPRRVIQVDSYEILNDDTVKTELLEWLGSSKPYNLETVSTTQHQTNRNKQMEIAMKYG